jgi:hypothetical protein
MHHGQLFTTDSPAKAQCTIHEAQCEKVHIFAEGALNKQEHQKSTEH